MITVDLNDANLIKNLEYISHLEATEVYSDEELQKAYNELLEKDSINGAVRCMNKAVAASGVSAVDVAYSFKKSSEETNDSQERDAIEAFLDSEVMKSGTMTREAILRAAIGCVCDDREKQYGKPKRNFEVISRFWSTYLGITLHPMDVSMMMAVLKIARIVTGGAENADSYIDAAGYIALAAETGGVERPRRNT